MDVESLTLTVDGLHLAAEHHVPSGKAKGGLVLLHGFSSSMREFGDAPRRWAEAGFHVLAFDQRGFGASEGERGRIGLDRVLVDTEAAVSCLKARAGKRLPLGLVGHSLGGAYAVGVLSRTGYFRAGAVAHPVDRLFDDVAVWQKPVYAVLGRLGRRRIRRGQPAGMVARHVRYTRLFEDKEEARRARREGMLLDRVHLGNYDFATSMQASAWARHVRVPMLCVGSPKDRIVAPEHSLAVCRALAGPVEILEHQGGHSCFRDLDRDRVIDGIAAFFTRHLGGRR